MSTKKGIIFDMDGVLIDAMPFHAEAMSRAIKEKTNHEIDKKNIYLLEGMPSTDLINEVFKREHIDDKVVHYKNSLQKTAIQSIQSRKLRISPSIVDATSYISKIATNAQVSQQTYREAVNMLSVAKKNPICHGKDPKAVAAAVLYASCLEKKEEGISQSKIATAGNISIVTLRKRLADILKICPEVNYMKTRSRTK